MQDIIPEIVALTDAVQRARNKVDDYTSKIIDDTLYQLEEHGFPYVDGLDIVTEHALFQQCSLIGREMAKAKVEQLLERLMMNEDFAS